jgi:(1->4)-alpha-D-glucan 1-alpha-D-glucosylmutase
MAFRVPRATYRIQFSSAFTFADAKRIASYLKELGITDVYASPILEARKGSTHGYDVVDANALNPELGSDEDFNALHEELRDLGLGLLLDVVPNHMAASAENSWWMSVLENGQHSRFLHYFDIDFSPVAAQGRTVTKVLLPILGSPYGEAVEAQEIQLGFGAEGFQFRYYDHVLPLAPESYRLVLRECLESLPTEGVGMELRELAEGDEQVPNSRFLKDTLWRIYEHDAAFRDALDRAVKRINGEAGRSESFNKLDALLDAQWYRLAYWRIASEKINYRRFFDVTDLVGVRVENPEVFEARNRLTLELIAEGKVTGLRIDHIDGLFDPVSHMRKLQLRLGEAGSQFSVLSSQSGSRGLLLGPLATNQGTSTENREPRTENFYIVVEKILAEDEQLPSEFPVSGTTGYDFLDSLNALFIDPSGLEKLTDFYRGFTGIRQSFSDVSYERKKQIISELFAGEMRALGKRLSALAMLDRNARDFPPSELLAALTEITACLRVYRTYIRDGTPADSDRRRVREAVAEARQRAGTSVDRRLLTFLERMLLLELPPYVESEREHWLDFVMRWQQFTGRVMAKGVEDTSFYYYNRLISLNEVGGWPGRSGRFDPVSELHARNERTQRDWPDTLNATSTHDTKRGQDARARINVLSEMAETWERNVRKWARLNAHLKEDGVPAANEELLVYQTLIGMWPFEEMELATVPERLRQYLEKAAREAKTYTSWIAPNADYERRFLSFGDAILRNERFRASFLRFQKRISFHGFLNGLAQVVLKVASPGVPDFYQGTELWDFSLVDPDNRRPVDFDRRSSLLETMKAAQARGAIDVAELLRRWQDSRVKLFVTWRALDVRTRNAEVFRHGDYRALHAGPNVFAFARGDDIVVAVPRLTTQLTPTGGLPLGDAWGDATLEMSGTFRNAFTSERVEGDRLALSQVFATFPVAILERV